jgi:hypothetical protein
MSRVYGEGRQSPSPKRWVGTWEDDRQRAFQGLVDRKGSVPAQMGQLRVQAEVLGQMGGGAQGAGGMTEEDADGEEGLLEASTLRLE